MRLDAQPQDGMGRGGIGHGGRQRAGENDEQRHAGGKAFMILRGRQHQIGHQQRQQIDGESGGEAPYQLTALAAQGAAKAERHQIGQGTGDQGGEEHKERETPCHQAAQPQGAFGKAANGDGYQRYQRRGDGGKAAQAGK